MERKPQSKQHAAAMEMELELLGNPPLDQVIDKVLEYNASHHGGSRVLQHGKDLLIAPMSEILDWLRQLQGERNLPRLRRKVQRTLDQAAPKMKDGTASQEEISDFAHGMVFLFAIDVLQGRETLNIH